MRVLIVGCGYVGLPLGAKLAQQGHEVIGLRRTAAAEAELTAAGIQPWIGDVTRLADLAALPGRFDWIVNCAASGGGEAEDYRRLYVLGNRNLIEWMKTAPPGKFVYTSSTSVYGQNDGSRVDETSPTEPAAETARVLVEAERLILDAARHEKIPALILRVAGIYGPGRGHWFKQFLKGKAHIEGEGRRILNMIHRDDVIGCLIAALEKGRPGEVYNAVDDEPVSQVEFFSWLANTLGRRLPEVVAENSKARRRGVSNKQVSNARLKLKLDYRFEYTDYREGYSAEIERLKQAGELHPGAANQ